MDLHGGGPLTDRGEAPDNAGDGEREIKARLVKAARMYAMCEKAGVAEPMDATGMAVAAFEDLPLRGAMVFVRTNEQNVRDLAWAFANSDSAEEFERRLAEIKTLPGPGVPRR
jgi:hypothetical protein